MEMKNIEKNIVDFIRSNRNALDIITDLVPIPLFIKDRNGLYIDCNTAFTKFLSISREEIIGKSVYDLWKKEEADIFFSQDNDLFLNGEIQIYETQVTSTDGSQHIVQFHKQVFTDDNDKIGGLLGAVFDITEKKELENALEKLATLDELTGLPNRREGISHLKQIQELSDRKNHSFCIAMIDIDHFKKINDQYGHANGDIVLREFADHAKANLRGSDVCFRYGGEEFVLLLPETDMKEAAQISERLRSSWSECQIYTPDETVIHSTISIGIFECRKHGLTCEELIRESDQAMYQAKSRGRNCICTSGKKD